MDEAEKAALIIGFPVVLKTVSPQILHKSDVGGVLLNINKKEAVTRGYFKVINEVTRARVERGKWFSYLFFPLIVIFFVRQKNFFIETSCFKFVLELSWFLNVKRVTGINHGAIGR